MNLVQKTYDLGIGNGWFKGYVFAVQVIKEQSCVRRHGLVHSLRVLAFTFLHLCRLLRETRVPDGRNVYRTHVSLKSRSLRRSDINRTEGLETARDCLTCEKLVNRRWPDRKGGRST